MTLRNRADPSGRLHARATRGLYTGNRGIIHEPETRTLLSRRWTTPAWICCALHHKEKHRDVWGRNGPNGGAGWTELFFLDEVTALAAGHRPCFACRYEDARRFQAAWARGGGNGAPTAKEMDRQLHVERWLSRRSPPEAIADLRTLPDGVIVEAGGRFYALKQGSALAWDFAGYKPPIALEEIGAEPILRVTPAAVVAALGSGYLPVWHASAS